MLSCEMRARLCAPQTTPNVVKRLARRTGFRLLKKTKRPWLATWGKRMKPVAYRTAHRFAKLNHLPGSGCIGRKDRLYINLCGQAARVGKKEYDFFPLTFLLPEQRQSFERKYKKVRKGTPWIVKPRAAARGAGIRVIHELQQIKADSTCLVQKYAPTRA